jgi:predicted RNase H-like nuclease
MIGRGRGVKATGHEGTGQARLRGTLDRIDGVDPVPANNILLIGVDGAKAGWFAVWRAEQGFGFDVYARAEHLLASHASAACIAVDIPIGLSDHGGRAPDALARSFVGGKRASSVFSAPVRGVLGATSHADASALNRRLDEKGRGITIQAFGILPKIRTIQAFGILPKIREWDTLLRADANARRCVREVHPEVSFAAMNAGVGLAAPKRSDEGHAQRVALLGQHFGLEQVAALLASVPRRMAAADDVADALAALWSAERIHAGRGGSLPAPPAIDSAGLQMAIWY